MSDDKAILTEDLFHKIVREVYRGKSVDEAFEATGVDPASGYAWLRNAG